jgi:hypothetical protein
VSCSLPSSDGVVGGGGGGGCIVAFDRAGMLNSKRWMATSSVHDRHFKKDSHSHQNEYEQEKRWEKTFFCYSYS